MKTLNKHHKTQPIDKDRFIVLTGLAGLFIALITLLEQTDNKGE